jgi:hypothetical protein
LNLLQHIYATVRGILTDRVPSWVRQTAMLIAVYVVVMLALAHWLSAWHDWDWRFFEWLKPAPTALSSQIALVDMQYTDPSDVPQHRALLANFIAKAAQQHPLAIILDIPFGQCVPLPCGQQMASSRQRFITAVESAARANVPVYANVGNVTLTPEGLPNGAAAQLDPQIYRKLSGYGHTAAVVLRTRDTDRSGDLFYDPCYPNYPPLFGGMPQDVWALVDVALHRDEVFGAAATRSRLCNPSEKVPVRYGPPIVDKLPAEYQISASSPFPRSATFTGTYVIVGVPAFDRDPQTTTRSGSELFAWIFSDELTYGQFNRATVQAQGSALLLLVPAFSVITALAFAAWFFLLKRLSLGSVRRFLPWIAAALSLCVGVAALVTFEAWMLRGPAHQIQPQVALISLGVVLAAALCGVRGSQIEFELRNKIDLAGPPEQHDYDVFMSYAHEELPWVLEHVYVPFQNARISDGSKDGRKLKLFFDTDTIRVGTAWQDKISLAIEGSKFIVPVFSDVYFGKPYCRFEIKRAHRKWINAGEESRCVLPIMRGHPKILGTVDDFQAKSIDDQPDIVERIIAEIVERLSRPAGFGEGKSAHTANAAKTKNMEVGS